MTEKKTGLTEARAVKRKAKGIFERLGTVTGIGLTLRQGRYAVKVLLAEPLENPEECPDAIDGVSVEVQVVGKISKQKLDSTQ